jgi:glycosyltransferase involved in cell wall biosynthesis
MQKVSIIIPAFNASATIETCLKSVYQQDYPNIEVIIVDDCSTDDTLQKASGFPVRIISNKRNLGAAYSRNVGARSAKSEILIFADSDIVIPRDGVSRITQRLLEQQDILIVGATYSENSRHLNFISDFKNLDLSYRYSLAPDYVRYLSGHFFALKKSTFFDCGSFSTHFPNSSVEDMAFFYSVSKGNKILFLDKNIKVDHLKMYSFFDMLKTDFARVINMIKIIKDSQGKYKAGQQIPLPYFLNIPLSILVILSIVVGAMFKVWWISGLLIFAFTVNNIVFMHFLILKRGIFFAIKGFFILFIEYMTVGLGIFISVLINIPRPLRR